MARPTSDGQVRDWLKTYDAQGWHRTGTRVDTASARWLHSAATDVGARAEFLPLRLERLVLRASSVTVHGRRFPGVPLFDATLPAAGNVCGSLGPLGSDASIGVGEVSPARPDRDFDTARLSTAHRAIVAITRGPVAGLALRNAPAREPFGAPVLQVSSRHAAALHRAAARASSAVFSVNAHRSPTTAYSVAAAFQPSEIPSTRVVVLTPRSGWWQCAAERGGGLACWLACLAASTDSAHRDRIYFLATTGHELGSLGLTTFLDDGPQFPAGPVWLHLGANIGARGGRLRLTASDAGLADIARAELARDGMTNVSMADAPVGEGRELSASGHRFVSIVGSNDRFHTPADRYPDAVDVETVTACARAVVRIVDALAQ